MAELKGKKEELLDRFDFAKKQGLDLIEEISQYAKANNSYQRYLMQGYTFETGLKLLEQEGNVVFNEDNRNFILSADENSNEFDFLLSTIEEQINHHGEIRIGLNIYFKSRN
jgi:hypothetical protein